MIGVVRHRPDMLLDLQGDLEKVLLRYGEEFDLSTTEAFGVLELIKMEAFQRSHIDVQTGEDDPDDVA